MYALDTNLLVYAHNLSSPFHTKAKTFIEIVMNERDSTRKLKVCIPAQALIDFLKWRAYSASPAACNTFCISAADRR